MVLAGLLWGGICTFFPNTIVVNHSFSEAFAGCLSCFAVMFAIYSYTNSGAGDVKLAAGIGAFLGVKGGLLAICYAYISAACFAGCLLIWLFGFGFALRGLLRFMNVWVTPESPEISAKAQAIMSRGLPLAPFFLVGTVLTLFDLLRFFPAM
jgi:prepilin signal peptidase PulO-like enzyme (type II secretory pathway)